MPHPVKSPDPPPAAPCSGSTCVDAQLDLFHSDGIIRGKLCPEKGARCTIPGSYLGACVFWREHVGPSGATSWIVVDLECNQYHAFHSDRVKLPRQRKR
jgi:hypothetical protein